MKISKRILGAALSGVLLAGSLAGCASNPGGNNTPAPSGSDNQYTGTSSPAPSVSTRPVGESVPLVATEDVVQKIIVCCWYSYPVWNKSKLYYHPVPV